MKKLKKLPVDRIVDVVCDVCGQSCKNDVSIEYAQLHVPGGWGYGSRKDGEWHDCDLCEDCYDKVRDFIENLGGHVRVNDRTGLWQTPNG